MTLNENSRNPLQQTCKLLLMLCLLFALFPLSQVTSFAVDEEKDAMDTTAIDALNDVEFAVQLGLLRGEGQGVTDSYLSKKTTRIQAAIMFLRLKGLENEALMYQGQEQFIDGRLAGKEIQPLLSYLKAHPELGWLGTGEHRFDPLASITAQQYYKVMLESLGYRQGIEFAYENTLDFAASVGISKISDVSEFHNIHIVTATIEALQVKVKDEEQTLVERLVSEGVLEQEQTVPLQYPRIDIMSHNEWGGYLTDSSGKTLYYFTKDAADPNACQGNCIQNWPIFFADQLLLAAGLNADDFGLFLREDGEMQTTYKGWPLYYFISDEESGDINGEGVGDVWYVLKVPEYSVMLGTQEELGTYLTDENGRTLFYFDNDPKGSSVCTGNCIVNWPVFYAEHIVVPSLISANDFGTLEREDGSKQTAYKGYPLYYFMQDKQRGEAKGQGWNDVWFVIQPSKFEGTTAEEERSMDEANQPSPNEYTVEIVDFAYSEPELTVEVGSSVTFINLDSVKHNAAAVNGSFAGPLLEEGESYTVTFDEPGEYDYYCEPHKSIMKGKIIVQ